MEDKLVTLAILTFSKAQILKNVLEREGIEAYIHNVNQIQPLVSSGVRLRIKESDLLKALKIAESSSWLADCVMNEEIKEVEKVQKILIPVDFSGYSIRACEFGFNLAALLKADIVLMHVYFNPVYMPSLQYATENYEVPFEGELGIKSMLENINAEVEDLTKIIEEKISIGKLPKVKYEFKLREGVPEEEILHYARTKKPLMIIMGTRGKEEKDLDLIGSVTAEIIDRSPVFVYAIPKEALKKNVNDINKIAFITNFDQRDLIGLDTLINTFKEQIYDISLLNLNNNEEKKKWDEIKLVGIKEYFKKLYPDLNISYDIIQEDKLLENLDDYVSKNEIDAICISNYKRNVFARLFNPSIARKMIFHSNTPILVIK